MGDCDLNTNRSDTNGNTGWSIYTDWTYHAHEDSTLVLNRKRVCSYKTNLRNCTIQEDEKCNFIENTSMESNLQIMSSTCYHERKFENVTCDY